MPLHVRGSILERWAGEDDHKQIIKQVINNFGIRKVNTRQDLIMYEEAARSNPGAVIVAR